MREKFKRFIKKIYNGWLEGMALMGKVDLPTYFDSYEPTMSSRQLAIQQLIEREQKRKEKEASEN